MTEELPFVTQALEWLHHPQTGMEQALDFYEDTLKDPACNDTVISQLATWDRFFLGVFVCNRADLQHPWVYDRCREVEANPDGHLDFWAREHYKSTLITFLGSIQEIIQDQEITIGIFSHTRPIAKAFLRQIKRECEMNPRLAMLWPHIFWRVPRKQAPLWSEDEGLVMQRRSNPPVATVEAHGLVDSQPTSKHFRLMIYDDVVTEKSVTSPDMIVKTTNAWELSRNLSAVDSRTGKRREPWTVGTRYNFADTYGVMLKRQVAVPRIYPATDNGLPDGKPVLFSPDDWKRKKQESSNYTIATQMLLNPVAGSEQKFKEEWFRRYEVRPETLNVAILVDPANSKKKGSCNSAFAVIGIDMASNKYLLDGCCHKMDLGERWQMLKYLRLRWLNQPGVQEVTVGYEKYGMQSDIAHHEEMMRIEGISFPIYPVNWVKDGSGSSDRKDDRIERLIPDHKNWRFFYPRGDLTLTDLQRKAERSGKGYLISRRILRKDHENKVYDLTEWFFANEYIFFPATTYKDFFDAMSRLYDLDIGPPAKYNEKDLVPAYVGEP